MDTAAQLRSRLGQRHESAVPDDFIRHTTLTDISRATNARIAAAYAGHSARTTTDLYTSVTFEELVAAQWPDPTRGSSTNKRVQASRRPEIR